LWTEEEVQEISNRVLQIFDEERAARAKSRLKQLLESTYGEEKLFSVLFCFFYQPLIPSLQLEFTSA
jgi:hypothetical protein